MAKRVKVENFGPGMTQGQFKDECDIKRIVGRYQRTGVLPQFKPGGRYGDFSEVGDYMEALGRVELARAAFASLSSDVRKRFRNDPGELVAFLQDPANRDEAVKLGLVEEKKVESVPEDVKSGGEAKAKV